MEAILSSVLGRTTLGQAPLTMGRAPDNQLVIEDTQASGHHATIVPGPDGTNYQLTDLGSTNGTFVNEQRLAIHAPRPLRAGDVVRIGGIRFTYETVGANDVATMRATPPSSYDATVMSPPPGQGAPTSYGPGLQATPPPQAYSNYNAAPPPVYPQVQPVYPQPQPGYGMQQPGYPQPQPGYQQPQPGYQQPQPGYGAPTLAGQPGGVPAPAPKKSKTGLLIGIVLALVVIIGGVFGVMYINRSTPTKTLQAFCSAYQNEDAQSLYDLFSQRQRAKTTVDAMKKSFGAMDKLGVKISACTVKDVTEAGATATGSMDIVIALGKTSPAETNKVSLVKENDMWKIDDARATPATPATQS